MSGTYISRKLSRTLRYENGQDYPISREAWDDKDFTEKERILILAILLMGTERELLVPQSPGDLSDD